MDENQTLVDKSKSKFKLFFFIVLLIAILEGVWIYLSLDWKKFILLPPYTLNDNGGLVTASGSWISSTELAYPIQTVQIECWKEFGHCWIMDSTLSDDDKYLSLNSTIEEIAKWSDDAIETVPSTTAGGCVEYFYRLDLRSSTVTATRSTVDNTTGLCEGIQDEPIIMHLGNGLERLRK